MAVYIWVQNYERVNINGTVKCNVDGTFMLIECHLFDIKFAYLVRHHYYINIESKTTKIYFIVFLILERASKHKNKIRKNIQFFGRDHKNLRTFV